MSLCFSYKAWAAASTWSGEYPSRAAIFCNSVSEKSNGGASCKGFFFGQDHPARFPAAFALHPLRRGFIQQKLATGVKARITFMHTQHQFADKRIWIVKLHRRNQGIVLNWCERLDVLLALNDHTDNGRDHSNIEQTFVATLPPDR